MLPEKKPIHSYSSRARLLKLSYKLALANMQGNFVRVTRLSRQLCPLTLSAFYIYLPVLQR